MHSFVTLRDQSGHCSSRRELMFLRLGQFRMGQSQQALTGRCRWGPSRYAWPGKWFCSGDKLIRWTVCTHAGQEMPMLASLGAKFTPKSSAAPEVEASSRMYQTFSAWGCRRRRSRGTAAAGRTPC
jgi:hypothetical protein